MTVKTTIKREGAKILLKEVEICPAPHSTAPHSTTKKTLKEKFSIHVVSKLLKVGDNMKQQRCITKEEYKPTFEEVAENRKVLDICKYYGIRIGYFSEKSMLTRDEAIALNYIIRHKNIPTDLRKRLLSTKHERITETPPTSQITEEEAFTLFGLTK